MRFTAFRSSLLLAIAVNTAAFAQTSQPAASSPMLDLVRTEFAAWDADDDGTLSFDEIELAVNNPKVTGPTAAAAAVLRNRAALRGKTLPEYQALLIETDNASAFDAALKKLAATNRAVFANGQPGSKLSQGKLGDCFLLASVGTMAQTDPQRLKSLVEELPDNQIAMNFGDGTRLVLPAPTDAEIIIGSNTRGDGIWGNVFEKMIGQRYIDRQTDKKRLTPYSYIGKGGTPNTPLIMLTGKKVKREGCEMFQKPGLSEAGKIARLEEIRVALESALSDKRVIVGGTGALSGTGTKVKGLYYNHSYGVLNYNRTTDLVTFWNPMSNGFTPKGEPGLENGYQTNFGRFDCPLTEAVMWFGSFSIEQKERLDPAAGG